MTAICKYSFEETLSQLRFQDMLKYRVISPMKYGKLIHVTEILLIKKSYPCSAKKKTKTDSKTDSNDRQCKIVVQAKLSETRPLGRANINLIIDRTKTKKTTI